MASIKFHSKHGTDQRPKGSIDWDEVRATLATADPKNEFAGEVRFDALKHALRILGSVSADKELDELRERWLSVDALVDAAVDTHYSGFNKSLQNYSAILRLFTEARTQIASLRRGLETAQSRLRPHPGVLKELYRRDLMLEDVTRLLEDVRLAVAVPGRVHALQQRGEWAAAATTLLDGADKVAREEVAGVGAVRQLREELVARRESLLAAIAAEIERFAFAPPHQHQRLAMGGAGIGGGYGQSEGDGSSGGGGGHHLLYTVPPGTTPGALLRTRRRRRPSASSFDAAGRDLLPAGGLFGTPQGHRRQGSSLGSGGGAAVAAAPASHVNAFTTPSKDSTGALADISTTMNPTNTHFGHVMDAEAAMGTLVSSVAQLGGVPWTLKTLRSHMAARMRAVIADAIETHLASSRQRPSGGGGGEGERAAAALSVAAAMEAVCARCLASLQSVARLMQLLTAARPPATTAGLQALLGAGQGSSIGGGPGGGAMAASTAAAAAVMTVSSPRFGGAAVAAAASPSMSGGDATAAAAAAAAAAAKECRFAWRCMQKECQAALGAMLGMSIAASAGLARRTGAEGGAAADGSGWLSRATAGDEFAGGDVGGTNVGPSVGPRAGTVVFSLAEESPGVLPAAATADDGDPTFTALRKPTGNTPSSIMQRKYPLNAPSSSGGLGAAAGRRGGGGPPSDLAPLVAAVLNGHPGRVELVASAYQPVIRLIDAAERLLAGVEAGGRGGAATTTPTTPAPDAADSLSTPLPRLSTLLHMPWRGTGTGAAPPDRPPSGPLRAHIDTILRMEFLPAVYVSTRERCQKLLDRGDAFRLPRTRLRGAYAPGAAVLPAATGAVAIAEEILLWARNVPPFAPHLAGVLENVLGRALEAFQTAIAEATGAEAVAAALATDVPTVQLLAKDPAASLAGPPAAFYVGAAGVSAMESMLSSAITAGFASGRRRGGGEVERELVDRIFASPSVRKQLAAPGGAGALLAPSGDPSRLLRLAALAESADYVADAIHAAAAAVDGTGTTRGKEGAMDTSTSVTPNTPNTPNTASERGFAGSLAAAADHYRAAAGRCVRTLRLELFLQAAHHLASLPAVGGTGPAAAAAAERVTALARVVASFDDAMAPYLPPDRRMYVFGSLPPAVVQIAVAMLPEFHAIDGGAVAQVCRLLSSIQPGVCAAGGVGEAPLAPHLPDPSRQLEKARMYYSLLTQSAEGLVAAAAAKPKRFSADEYMALLAAPMQGRRVTKEHKQQLANILAAASGGR